MVSCQFKLFMVGYYLALEKKEILSFVTMWMRLEDIMLNEISRDRKINTT
jgi:hypothetical protein